MENKKPVVTHTKSEVLDKTAVGLYRNKETGEWYVAVVTYNADTKQAKVVELLPSGGSSRDYGEDKFKMVVIEKGLFTQD